MFLRMFRSMALIASRLKPSPGLKDHKDVNHSFVSSLLPKLLLYLLLCLLLWLLLLFLNQSTIESSQSIFSNGLINSVVEEKLPIRRKCELGGYFYMYNLPDQFNVGLLRECKNLSSYTDMCPHVANRGLGQTMGRPSWYRTHQFIAEMIFHARAERHPCRTMDPDLAVLFYVPFYGGLHSSSMLRHPNHHERDRLPLALQSHLLQLPSWHRHAGADHFLVLGRTAWDFMRDDSAGSTDYGANRLLRLPTVRNMSVLTVERHPWEGANQFGIPYTSYFHPSSGDEVHEWQERVRGAHRPHLLSFVGGPRKGVEKAEVRNEIFRVCEESHWCHPVKCVPGSSECHDPDRVLEVMTQSVFCAQPPGDSFTRRSVFDSVLAGCIPVFFSPHTAYTQYQWFFPANPGEYSVFVPEDKARSMEDALVSIPGYRVRAMREKVISMIPRITYTHPNATDIGFQDAVDVALENLMKHVRE